MQTEPRSAGKKLNKDSELYEVRQNFLQKVNDHHELEAFIERLSVQLKISKRNIARRKNEEGNLETLKDKILIEIHEKVSAVWDKVGLLEKNQKNSDKLESELQCLREKNKKLECEIAELKIDHECKLLAAIKESVQPILLPWSKRDQNDNGELIKLKSKIRSLPKRKETPIEILKGNVPTNESIHKTTLKSVPSEFKTLLNAVEDMKLSQISLLGTLDEKNLELKAELLAAMEDMKQYHIDLTKNMVSKIEGQALIKKMARDKEELKSDLLQAIEGINPNIRESWNLHSNMKGKKLGKSTANHWNYPTAEAIHSSTEEAENRNNSTACPNVKRPFIDTSLRHEIIVLKSLLRSLKGHTDDSGVAADFNSNQAVSITKIVNSTEKLNSMLSFLIDCVSTHSNKTLKELDALNKKIQVFDMDVLELWKNSFPKPKNLKKPDMETLRSNSFPGHSRTPQQLIKKLGKWDDKIWQLSRDLTKVVEDLKICKGKWSEQIAEDLIARKKIMREENKYRKRNKRITELKNTEQMKDDVVHEVNLGKLHLEKESRRLSCESKRLNCESDRLKREWEKINLTEKMMPFRRSCKVNEWQPRSELCILKRLELSVTLASNAQEAQQQLISKLLTKNDDLLQTVKDQEKKIDIFLSETMSEMVAMYAKESLLSESILTLLNSLKVEIGWINEDRKNELGSYEKTSRQKNALGQEKKIETLCSHVWNLTKEVRKSLKVSSNMIGKLESKVQIEGINMEIIQDLKDLLGNLLRARSDRKDSESVLKLSSEIAKFRELFRSANTILKNNKRLINARMLGKLELIGNSINESKIWDFMSNFTAHVTKEQNQKTKNHKSEIVGSYFDTTGNKNIIIVVSELKYPKRTAWKVEKITEHLIIGDENFNPRKGASNLVIEEKLCSLSSNVDDLKNKIKSWKHSRPPKLESLRKVPKSVRETGIMITHIQEPRCLCTAKFELGKWAFKLTDFEIFFNSTVDNILAGTLTRERFITQMMRFYNMALDPALTTNKQRKIDILVSVRNTIKPAFDNSISILGEEYPKNMSEDVKQIREMPHSLTCKTREEIVWEELQIWDVAQKVRESLNNQGTN